MINIKLKNKYETVNYDESGELWTIIAQCGM